MVYLHEGTPPIYGAAPLPQHGDANFCVRESEFQFSNARACSMSQLARFSVAKPSDSPNGQWSPSPRKPTTLAGVQRLLSIDRYDATPIDRPDGAKTKNALARFL